MLKRIVFLLALMLPAFSVSASWDKASEVMGDATRRMLDLVEDEELKKSENIDQLMSGIEAIVGPIVDYEYIGKSVMGKYVRQATDEQIDRFSEVFKTTLLRTYAKSIVAYKFESYEVLPNSVESPEPEKQIVNVELTSSDGRKYSIVYYMALEQKRWTLVNVLIDGVNLRITFRNQFSGLYEEHSTIDAVIEQWANAMSAEVN